MNIKGNIVVQSPAKLKVGDLNVIDEFQNLSFHNIKTIEDTRIWKDLILMSATPFVPLLAAAIKAKI